MERVFFDTKVLAGDTGAVSGVAWKFDQPDRIGDMIEAAAFKGIKGPVPMLFGHDQGEPLGVWDSVEVRGAELHVSGKLLVDDVARAREVFALVKAGAVRALSLGFLTRKFAARQGGGRTIKALELIETSLCVSGMHPGARVTSAKSAVAALRVVAALNSAAAQIAR